MRMGYQNNNITVRMPYLVTDLNRARLTVIASAVAMLVAYSINFFFQMMVTCCFSRDPPQKAKTLERLLQTSRVMYWFAIATMFSVFPPFYYGSHCAAFAWGTLLLVLLMHIFCIVRRCDKERSVWAYMYYFYHVAIGCWIATSLIVGYVWSRDQLVPSDSIE